MSLKQSFRLLDALEIPNDGELTLPENTDEMPEVSEEEFKENILKMSQDKLCEIIVCYRYLGLMQAESILAMEELAARRARGEVFNFEERIEKLSEGLPSIHIDLNKMLKKFRM